MKFSVSIWWVILAFLIATCLAYFVGCFVYTGQLTRQRQTYEKQIELIRYKKDSVIKENYVRIHVLEKTIEAVDNSIQKYETRLSELSNKKERIKIVYRDRYKDVEAISDTAIVDYWLNKFNDE